MRCELISWETFYALCRRLTALIREAGFQPDLIVAVDRGGYLPARILADHLGIMDLVSFKIEHYHGARKDTKAVVRYPLPDRIRADNLLLVDDVSDSGDTFTLARSHVEDKISPVGIRTAVLHHKTVSAYQPDFYAAKVETWRWIIYPWAVIEDLSSFIKQMQPNPGNKREVMARLRADYGLDISSVTAEDILAHLARQKTAEVK